MASMLRGLVGVEGDPELLCWPAAVRHDREPGGRAMC